MTDSETGQIDNVMQEDRLFPPSEQFRQNASIASMDDYQKLYDAAKNDPDKFWGDTAKEELHWFEPFDTVCKHDGSQVEWFVGGKTNISYNCLDANIEAGNGDRVAIIWEGEPGDTLTLTIPSCTLRSASFPTHSKDWAWASGMWFRSTCR